MSLLPKSQFEDVSSGSAEVTYTFSSSFPATLDAHSLSLIVSTYQAGHVVTIGSQNGELVVDFACFDRPMGVAYSSSRIAVATRQQIWLLVTGDSIAPQLAPEGRYQRAFLARQSVWTGDIHAHEVGWAGDELLVVNTAFSCLCTLHGVFSFVPQWRPPFVSALAAEDRCHLNGVAIADGSPLFATALGKTDTPAGWRPDKATSGVLLTLPEGETAVSGLCMPHSPRIHRGELWLLNSGCGQLLRVESMTGYAEVVTLFPGYARGLSLWRNLGFVGLSKIRETSVFGGIPIAEHRTSLRCGIAVVDLKTGTTIGKFEFSSGVDEIFDVVVVPEARCLKFAGPCPSSDDETIWLVPTPRDQTA